MIGEWSGKIVKVALRVGGGLPAHHSTSLAATLIQVDEAGVLLELPKEKLFVPTSAILHISLPND